MIQQELKNFRQAVNEAIINNQAKGLSVYQREKNYIIAIYPNGHKVQLEKIGNPIAEKALWYRPH